MDAGTKFAEVAEEEGFTLADKSRIVASSLPLARFVSGKLKEKGILIKAVAVADDLWGQHHWRRSPLSEIADLEDREKYGPEPPCRAYGEEAPEGSASGDRGGATTDVL